MEFASLAGGSTFLRVILEEEKVMNSTNLKAIKKKLAAAGLVMASTVFGAAGGSCSGDAVSIATNGDGSSAVDFSAFGSGDTGSSAGIPVQR